MIKKIEYFIESNKLIPSKSKVVVGVSGGVDSMALLNILLSLGYDVVIGHVNHKKRVESEDEEKYLIDLAKRIEVPIEVMHLKENNEENFQSYAHDQRYEFFISVAKKHNALYIATAHHLDDNLETILLNLISGSNINGYAGISPKINIKNMSIIRPFLCVSKDEIINYSNKINLVFFEDKSNLEDCYTRNRLRHNVVPLLKKESNDLLKKIASYSNQLRTAFDYIREQSIDYLEKNGNTIDVLSFKRLHKALKNEIISILLENYDIEKSERIIQSIYKVIISDKSQADISLKDGWIFKKRYSKAFIEKPLIKNDFEIKLESFNDVFINNTYKIYFSTTLPETSVKNYAKKLNLCYNNITFPLVIRNRREGDAIILPSGRKKIKDLFIDKKIIKEQRESILIVEDDDGILWVVDIAKSKRAQTTKDTGNIYLIIEEC